MKRLWVVLVGLLLVGVIALVGWRSGPIDEGVSVSELRCEGGPSNEEKPRDWDSQDCPQPADDCSFAGGQENRSDHLAKSCDGEVLAVASDPEPMSDGALTPAPNEDVVTSPFAASNNESVASIPTDPASPTADASTKDATTPAKSVSRTEAATPTRSAAAKDVAAPTTAAPQTATPVDARESIRSTTTTTPAPTANRKPGSSTGMNMQPSKLGSAENIALIKANSTRNTQYDNNTYRSVPMSQLKMNDLAVTNNPYAPDFELTDREGGYFRVKCEVSHFAYDDPIVFPGQPGRAHLHMFFGNTDSHAFTTFDSLRNNGTGTCNGEDLNRTSYWVPALLDKEGNALIPFDIMVYYKNETAFYNGGNEQNEPYPDNLRMVVGNAMATSPQYTLSGGPGSAPIVGFTCGVAYRAQNLTALIPDCVGNGNGGGGLNGRALEMRVLFPQCFNPEAGTYLRDGSHMSYSDGGFYAQKCPASHPVGVPSITYRIFYAPDDYGGSLTNLHLSSDVRPDGEILPGGTTLHADWWGGWHPQTIDRWVTECNNVPGDCKTGMLDLSGDLALKKRKRGFYRPGYRAPAEELVKLCPGKTFDSDDPLRSVANCHSMKMPS